MNHSFSRFRATKSTGFTLVELLVVIGIIAILAGVLLAGLSSAINASKRVKAGNMATQLHTATAAYYTEYSVYPVPTGTTTDYVINDNDAASWKVLICALCGNINPLDGSAVAATTISNSRGIQFLNLKSSEVDAGVGPKNPLPPDNVHLYFNIAIDSDYDGILGGASSSNGKLRNFVTAKTGTDPDLTGACTAGVAVWADCNGSTTSKNPAWWVHTY